MDFFKKNYGKGCRNNYYKIIDKKIRRNKTCQNTAIMMKR